MNKFLACFLFLSTFFSLPTLANELSLSKGAVCVVDDGFRVVLIEELITGKLSLPGGSIDEGESAKEAAERETWEEAGLVVTATDVLCQDEKATIFRCVSNSDIVAFDLQTTDGFFRIPSWFAPHYGIETEAVYLTEPYKVNPKKYRYPEQLEQLKQWFAKPIDNGSNVVWVTNLVDQASGIHQYELKLLMSLRESINALPSIINVTVKVFFTFINETGQAAFFYFLVVVALVYFGRESALTLLFSIVFSIVLSELARQGLNLPRPFFYVPQLQLTSANGFGMPSMQSMLSTVVYGTFYLALKRNKVEASTLKLFVQVCVPLFIMQSIAHVWLGVHFLSDVIVGVLLGMMVVYHFSSIQKKHGDLLYRVMGSISFWLLMAIITSGIAFIMFHMNYLYVAALCWGTTLALVLKKEQAILNTTKGRLIAFCSIITLMLVFRFGTYELLAALPSRSILVLTIKTIANFMLMFVIIIFSAWLSKKLKIQKK
ncbi:bifunctional NUDIX hydrolase/phosphatase PAP2 family protein [Aliivibrio sifiae]|uniref:undecaprenyl-diphosphate phosphatase n=1 Tax=Aliivibrio sifiae TaxID=566293 RepID=A0A2S7XDI4_9GAMM|nr:phosphatase PAP2 family protein [Aliivibrio sifiae]PQJ89433.1 phosphohydrolase [Aliivibrio sifiae]